MEGNGKNEKTQEMSDRHGTDKTRDKGTKGETKGRTINDRKPNMEARSWEGQEQQGRTTSAIKLVQYREGNNRKRKTGMTSRTKRLGNESEKRFERERDKRDGEE